MIRPEYRAQIDADMHAAARMPFSQCVSFMANYGATLRFMADESGTAFSALRAYADKAYSDALTAVSA